MDKYNGTAKTYYRTDTWWHPCIVRHHDPEVTTIDYLSMQNNEVVFDVLVKTENVIEIPVHFETQDEIQELKNSLAWRPGVPDIKEKRYWFITAGEYSGSRSGWIYWNVPTEMSPMEFKVHLDKTVSKRTAIIYAIEITKEEFDKFKDEI